MDSYRWRGRLFFGANRSPTNFSGLDSLGRSALRLGCVLVVLVAGSPGVVGFVFVAAVVVVGSAAASRFGNLGEGNVGESRGIDPRNEATNLSRVLVPVNEGAAAVGRFVRTAARGTGVVLVEAGRQLQRRGALVVEVGNAVSESARAVFVLAFGPVIRRERQ